MKGGKHARTHRAHLATPVVGGLVVAAGVLALYLGLAGREADLAAHRVEGEAAEVRREIERTMEASLRALERMADRWERSGGTDRALWEADAANYLRDHDAQRALEWVDPSFHVRWVVPLADHESDVGLDLGDEPRRRAALETARDSDSLAVSRVVRLVQGGRGFLAAAPLLRDGELRGFLLGVYDVDALFATVLDSTHRRGFEVSVYDEAEPVYGLDLSARGAADTEIRFRNARWFVRVRGDAARTWLPEAVLAAGSLLALLVGAILWLGRREVARARAIQRMNRELEQEVGNRIRIEADLRDHHARLEEVVEERTVELLDARKLESVGQLAGGIAHELNNKLSVVLSCAELALEEPDVPQTVREELGLVQGAADHCARLTRQLLAFGRQQVLQPRPLDPNEVVRKARPALVGLLPAGTTLRTRFGDDLPRVNVDPARFAEAFTHLVHNARDAMPDGGGVTLSTRADGADVVFAVRDEGAGMDAATRARVFEPFFTTKDVGDGAGLGLPAVHGIVLQSGGTIDVTSAPGAGTTVEMRVPGIGPPAARADRRARAVVVEDSADVLRVVRRVLEHGGYEVDGYATGPDALAALAGDGRVDVVLTDLRMPGMDGRELAERARDLRPGMPIVVMSGYGEDAFAGEAFAGDVVFYPKPISTQRLLDTLERARAAPVS